MYAILGLILAFLLLFFFLVGASFIEEIYLEHKLFKKGVKYSRR